MSDTLVVMRLIDMVKVHPHQVTMNCSSCGELVGVYPTGQKMLREHPGSTITCQVCIAKDLRPDDVVMPAGNLEEIRQEARESTKVPRT